MTGGFVTPHNFLGIIMMAAFVFCLIPRGSAPPGIDSGRFASARVDSGGLVVFCVQQYNLGLVKST